MPTRLNLHSSSINIKCKKKILFVLKVLWQLQKYCYHLIYNSLVAFFKIWCAEAYWPYCISSYDDSISEKWHEEASIAPTGECGRQSFWFNSLLTHSFSYPATFIPLAFSTCSSLERRNCRHRAQINAEIRRKLHLLQNLTLWCLALTPHLKIGFSYFCPLYRTNGDKSYPMQEADESLLIAHNEKGSGDESYTH